MKNWQPPRALLFSWLGLLALLGLTVMLAYQPFSSFNTGLALAIATGKSLIVAAIFMELRRSGALMIAFAAAGLFWLSIMFWLALADYLTRTPIPAALS